MNIQRLEEFSNNLKENMIEELQTRGFDIRSFHSPTAAIDNDGSVLDSDDDAFDHIRAKASNLEGTDYKELLDSIIVLFFDNRTRNLSNDEHMCFYIYEFYPLLFCLPNETPMIKWHIRYDYKIFTWDKFSGKHFLNI